MPKHTLKLLYKHFIENRTGEENWIMKYEHAEFLYEYVSEHPFKKILGLGTGIGFSDCVICLALLDKGITDFHIDSIEQYDKCVKLADKYIPDEFKPYITVHQIDADVWHTDLIPYQYFSIYQELPEGDYDLIINDGPGFFIKDNKYVDLPNGTIMKLLLEEKLKPGTNIVYDGREASMKLHERNFSDNFFLTYYRMMPRSTPFGVIERKDNPVNFRDDLWEAVKNTNYFKDNEPNKNVSGGNG